MKRYTMLISLSLLLVVSKLATAVPMWTFDDPDEIATWGAITDCSLSVENGMLKTESTTADPYFFPGGEWATADWEPFSGAEHSTIYMRLKVNRAGEWQVYYTTEENGNWGEDQRQNFTVEATGDFADVTFVMERGGWQENTVNHFRIDPGVEAGITAEIDYISLESLATPVESKGKLAALWSALKR
jgi:hypothetical protein